MGSRIHDGFLDSWNPCVKDFRILDLLESIIGFNKSFVQWAEIEVKNKKLMPKWLRRAAANCNASRIRIPSYFSVNMMFRAPL